MRPSVSSAIFFMVPQVAVSEAEDSLMASTTPPMAAAKSAIAASMVSRRALLARSAASLCSAIALVTSSAMAWETTVACSASLRGEYQYLRASTLRVARST